jgi:hypothetical protein
MAPGYFGEFGALPNHLPFLAQLQPGEVKYRIGGQLEYVAVSGGYAEVLPTKVTILATTAEQAKDTGNGLSNVSKSGRRKLIFSGLKPHSNEPSPASGLRREPSFSSSRDRHQIYARWIL